MSGSENVNCLRPRYLLQKSTIVTGIISSDMTPNKMPNIISVCDLFLLFWGVTVVYFGLSDIVPVSDLLLLVWGVTVVYFGSSVLGKYIGCKVFITK